MPRAFRFRMERLLDLRRHAEEGARRRLAEAMQEVQGQNRRLLAMMQERDAGKAALRAMRIRDLDLDRLRLQEEWLGVLEGRIREGFDRLQDLVREEVDRRRALTEAGRAVKVLERLRDRRLREWARREEREERNFLDEAAARREGVR